MHVSSLTFGIAALILVLATACARLPEIDDFPAGAAAPPPSLLPMDDLLAQVAAPTATAARGDALSARAARLRVRAALMRGPVHDPATRARLAEAIRQGRA